MTWDQTEGRGTATSTFEGLFTEDAEYGETRCHYAHEGDCEVYYRADRTIKWTWDSHHLDPERPCSETTSGVRPTGLELHDDQQLLIVAPLGDGKFAYWGQGNFTLPGITFKCMAHVGEGAYNPPNFFYVQEGSSAGNSDGGGNTCWANDWHVDTTADTISGSCYQFKYDYNSLYVEWNLHRVGPPPPGG